MMKYGYEMINIKYGAKPYYVSRNLVRNDQNLAYVICERSHMQIEISLPAKLAYLTSLQDSLTRLAY